jgi:response regulator RpfG family c-di-GMP phosphodiesterase
VYWVAARFGGNSVSLTDAKVLVVDDEPQVCALIHDGLAGSGLDSKTLSDPVDALEQARSGRFRVIITDVSMPTVNGLDILSQARRALPSCRVILITGVSNTRFLADALRLGAYDYFQKPFEMDKLIDSVDRALKDDGASQGLTMRAARAIQQEDLHDMASLETISALVHAVEAKDPYTRRHSEQVTFYAASLAEYARLSPPMVESIRVASLLHDVGKIGVPDSILTKPGALSDEEFAEIQKHPAIGQKIVEKVSMLVCETQLIRHHHERWDGRGYPDGLAGEEIPIGARIINLADSIDAMLMLRTYKKPYSIEEMMEELRRCAGSQFDPKLARSAHQWCLENRDRIIRVEGGEESEAA